MDLLALGCPVLRIPLDGNLEILPRLRDNVDVYSNTLDANGQPTIWHHGTYGLYALNIVKQRHLQHGTVDCGMVLRERQ